MVVLKIVGIEGRILNPETSGQDEVIGQYIQGLYQDPDGRIGFMSTDDIHKAKSFETRIDALDYWKQEFGPRRADGKPNRPLTVFSVMTEEVTEEVTEEASTTGETM